MKAALITRLKDNKRFIVFLVLLFVFRGAIADWNPVPTGSMKPTIKEGDVILVNKLACGIKLPFSNIVLYHKAKSEHGDIIVFKSQAADNRPVKHLIGLPGDSISLNNNHLIINGQPSMM